MSNEDPMLWRGPRGWHLLMHSMMSANGTRDFNTRGIHAFSKTGRHWTILPDAMWGASVTWTNGSTTKFFRRQAPTLYLGSRGQPVALQTAVDHLAAPTPFDSNETHPEGGCWWGRGWTFVQQVAS